MKRLIIAALMAASCTPATTGPIAAPPAASGSAAPTGSASPASSTAPTSPAAQPSAAAAALGWPRLADLPVTAPIAKARLWARSVSDVYAVVGTPAIWHYDGTSWKAIAVPAAGDLISITGNGDAVWAGTDKGAVAKLAKGGTEAVIRSGLSTAALPALALIDGATDTLLAACTDGSSAALVIRGQNATPHLQGQKAGTAVAVGKGRQFVFAGGLAAYRDSDTAPWITRTDAASDPIRAAVAYPGGRSDLDLMGVGDLGTSTRISGGQVQPFGTTTARPQLNDVGAASAGGLFAVGNNGLILYFASEAWRPIVSEASLGDILAMTALADREIIILTSKGQVFRGPYYQYI
jgi:hypothetical protein